MTFKSTALKMRGQPKKSDTRINFLRMMLNDEEKELFYLAGFNQTHKLRKWLLNVIKSHENKKDLIDYLNAKK